MIATERAPASAVVLSAVPREGASVRAEIDRRLRAMVSEIGRLADLADRAGDGATACNLLALADIATRVRLARP
jgi:hypothetical protein